MAIHGKYEVARKVPLVLPHTDSQPVINFLLTQSLSDSDNEIEDFDGFLKKVITSTL